MNTKKFDRAWSVFEEIRNNRLNSGYINVGFIIGGALPMEKETREWQDDIQGLTTQPLNEHPDPTLSAEDYGRALNKVLTSGLASKLNLERVLLPTDDFAERLKKIKATYFEYIGLAMVMDEWFDALFEDLASKGFDLKEYTDEELMELFNRSVGLQGDLYLMCLENRGVWKTA